MLCEKPLAVTPEDARLIIEEADRSKRILYPVENYRHAPVIVAVRQLLETGLIGTVHDVSLSTFRNTHARGVKEWSESWRREKRYAGGGVAMDHGSQTFYLAFEWLRSYPTSITAKMRTQGAFDTEDTFIGSATFPTGLAAVHPTWTAGVRKVIYTLHGDRGAIRVEDDDIEVAVMGDSPADRASGRSAWELKTKKVASEWMDAGLSSIAVTKCPNMVRNHAASGSAHHARVDVEGKSALLTKGVMEMLVWGSSPAVTACARLGITPDAVTYTSLALGFAAGGALATGHFGIGALLATAAAAGDAVDGLLARKLGVGSPAGELLDAAVDRYVDFSLLAGVAFWFRGEPARLLLALFALLASFMVSYSTAKAEALHVEPPRGSMRRVCSTTNNWCRVHTS